MPRILLRHTFSHRFQELLTNSEDRVSPSNQTFVEIVLRDVVVQSRDLRSQFENCTVQLEGEIATNDTVDWSVHNSTPAWFGCGEPFQGERLLAMDGKVPKLVKSAEYLRLKEGAIQLVNPVLADLVEKAPAPAVEQAPPSA